MLYDAKIIGLNKDRQELYKICDRRVDKMINDGLIDEIKNLLEIGVSFDNQCMQGIGYKEFKSYFDGTSSIEECVELVKRNTRHFVKRQYTWFNNQMPIEWYSGSNLDGDDIYNSIDKWRKTNEV